MSYAVKTQILLTSIKGRHLPLSACRPFFPLRCTLQVDGFFLDEVESCYDFEKADFYREDDSMANENNIKFCCQLADFELLANNASERQGGSSSSSNPSGGFPLLHHPLRHHPGGSFYDLVKYHDVHPSDRDKFEVFMRQFRQRRISVQKGHEGLFEQEEYKPPMYCSQRRLFLTRNGFVGVGVPSLQPGDSVVFLFGLPLLLFVIRKHEGGYCTFVGACRVKGAGANGDSLMRYYHHSHHHHGGGGGRVRKERFLIT